MSKTPQEKIDVEADAGKMMRMLFTIGSCAISGNERAEQASEWLRERGYVAIYRGCAHITMEGQEYYEGLCRNPSVRVSVRAFKEEALTGTRTRKSRRSGFMITEQSDLGRAALPTCSAPHETKTPEDAFDEAEQQRLARQRLCHELKITPEKMSLYAEEGRVRQCGNHWGVFDRRGQNGWQHLCRKCRKTRRKS
jgi:hypothetical protein